MPDYQSFPQVSDIFTSHLRDLRSARIDGSRPRRTYTTGAQVTIPLYARFKLQVYFLDGNCRYFYSYDQHKHAGANIHDEWVGLSALLHQLDEWRHRIVTASIYANMDADPKTCDKKYDVLVFRYRKNKYRGTIDVHENKNLIFQNIHGHCYLRVQPKGL